MNKKGFTLVEMIAVLIIISVITAIATPNIAKLMKDSKSKSFISDVNEIVSNATYMYKNESVRNSNSFIKEDDYTYKIYLDNINGDVFNTDAFGYNYVKNSCYILFKEPKEGEVKERITEVHIKTCDQKTSICHCIDKDSVNNLSIEDVKDC